jgi:hypothetical protein
MPSSWRKPLTFPELKNHASPCLGEVTSPSRGEVTGNAAYAWETASALEERESDACEETETRTSSSPSLERESVS